MGLARRRSAPLLALLGVTTLGLTLAAGFVRGEAGTDGRAGTGVPAAVGTGDAAPTLAGPTLTGEPFDLAALRGRVVVVNVFASWCGPCRDELPLLVDTQRRWSGLGLRVVGLDVRDSTEAVGALLDETGARELAVVPDPAGTTAVDWGARGVPETFVVDRDGRIAHWEPGPVTPAWLDQRLVPLLAP